MCICTDTARQLVQQYASGTRSSSYSTLYRYAAAARQASSSSSNAQAGRETLYRYAAAARPAMHRRDETSSSVGHTPPLSSDSATTLPATPKENNHHYTHYSTPPHPLLHSHPCYSLSSLPDLCYYTSYTDCYNTQTGHPLLHSTPPLSPLPPLLLVVLFTRLVLLY